MKKNIIKARGLLLIFGGLSLCTAVIPVFALEKTVEEQKLETAAGELDRNHSEVQQRRVANKLKAQFGVDGHRLLGMRYKKMGYGEIAIMLCLAQGLHGGITDKNLYKIAGMRKGPPVAGWDKIAGALGQKLGPATTKIRTISEEVRKQEIADNAKNARKAAGDKAAQSKKMGRTERSEKASMQSMISK